MDASGDGGHVPRHDSKIGGNFWLHGAGDDLTPRPAPTDDLEGDVVIVGAGYTGLWTAYYLLTAEPSLRVVVLERQIAGYGASGRNGGWCSALFPQSVPALARRHGRDAALALHRAMRDTVDEVGRVAAAEDIDCDYAKGGTVVVARSPAQLARARAEVAAARDLGLTEPVLLGPDEARDRLGATRVLGGTYTPHCAAIHPANLVRGLARAVERRGGRIYERTPARRLRPGLVETENGTVRAPVVVRATEGWTATLPGYRRTVAPVYSLMVATPPLPDEFWERAGLAGRETFADYRHLVIYGQRTADDRLAFGGRGAPYHFGSRIRPEFDRHPQVFAALRRTLADLFPELGARGLGAPDLGAPELGAPELGALGLGPEVPVEYAWGGPLGVARDWYPSVGLDRSTGLAWAGGYVGDGVATANLAGRTLADLIRGVPSELTRLPWVGHRSRRWEPEPLRWLGVNAGLRAVAAADATEARSGRPSRLAAALSRLLGG